MVRPAARVRPFRDRRRDARDSPRLADHPRAPRAGRHGQADRPPAQPSGSRPADPVLGRGDTARPGL